jgi:hypothetical protein
MEESPDKDDDDDNDNDIDRFRPMFRCSWFPDEKEEAVVALSSPRKVDVDRHKQTKQPISIVESLTCRVM